MSLKVLIAFFAVLAVASACDLERSDAHPTRLFRNWNDGEFEDFNNAFHRDSVEFLDGNAVNGIFSGATSLTDLAAVSGALGNPTFALTSVQHKSDSETTFTGSFGDALIAGSFVYRHCRISEARVWVDATGEGVATAAQIVALIEQEPFTTSDSQDDDDDNTSERLYDTDGSNDDDDDSSSDNDDDSSDDDDDGISSSSYEQDSSYCSSSSSSSSSSSDDEDMMMTPSGEDMEEEMEEGEEAEEAEEGEAVKRHARRHARHHKKKAADAAVLKFKRSSDDDDDDSSSSSSSSSSSYDCDPTSVTRDFFRSYGCHQWHHLASLFHREGTLSVNGVAANDNSLLTEGQLKCIGSELNHFRFHIDSVVRNGDDETSARVWLELFTGEEIPIQTFFTFTDRCRIDGVQLWSQVVQNADSVAFPLVEAFGNCGIAI